MADLFVSNTGNDGSIGITLIGGSTGITGGGMPHGTSDDYVEKVLAQYEEAYDDFLNFKQPDTTKSTSKVNFKSNRGIQSWDYNLNDKLFHSAFSLADILLLDVDSIANPYDKLVPISIKTAYDRNQGKMVHQYTYGNNPAYLEFETLRKEARNIQNNAREAETQRLAEEQRIETQRLAEEYLQHEKTIKSVLDNDNMDVDYFYATEKAYDAHDYFSYNYNISQADAKQVIALNSTGQMNRWMAGGDLYDAPRAGDVMFNVAGNLNTVRFLGLQDTNSTPDLVQNFVSPNVSGMLGPMAGDNNFSVL